MIHKLKYCLFVACLCGLTACRTEKEAINGTEDKIVAEVNDEWKPISSQKIEIEGKRAINGVALEGLQRIGTDREYYCNNTENLICWRIPQKQFSVLVCKDPVYDITYFVNYGEDNRIYALRDGVKTMAVDAPGRELFCRDGILYFIVDDYSKYDLEGVTSGNILSYNPMDGKIEVIVEEAVNAMRVYPDAINYQICERIKTADGGVDYNRTTKVYSFAEKKVIQEYDLHEKPYTMEMERWEDHPLYFKNEGDGMELCYKDESGEMIPIFDMAHSTGNYWIVGDKAYYFLYDDMEEEIYATQFYAYNFSTKETSKVVEFPNPAEIGFYFPYKDGFLLRNAILYDSETESFSFLNLQLKENKPYSGMARVLFTDGENLFGVIDDKLYLLEIKEGKGKYPSCSFGGKWTVSAGNQVIYYREIGEQNE